jgi:hypothetical protein
MTGSPSRCPGTAVNKTWLTFNDGPRPDDADIALDVLKAYRTAWTESGTRNGGVGG